MSHLEVAGEQLVSRRNSWAGRSHDILNPFKRGSDPNIFRKVRFSPAPHYQNTKSLFSPDRRLEGTRLSNDIPSCNNRIHRLAQPLIYCRKCKKLLKMAGMFKAIHVSHQENLLGPLSSSQKSPALPYISLLPSMAKSDGRNDRTLSCSKCGQFVTMNPSDCDLFETGSGTSVIVVAGRRSNSVRLRLRKIQKKIVSSFTANPTLEGSQLVKENHTGDSQLTRTTLVTPAHSRSTSGTGTSSHASDVDGCEIAEYNDETGDYLILEKKPSTETEEVRPSLTTPKSKAGKQVSRSDPSTPTIKEFSPEAFSSSVASSLPGEGPAVALSPSANLKNSSRTSSPVKRSSISVSQWSKSSNNYGQSASHDFDSLNGFPTSPNLEAYRLSGEADMTVAFKADPTTLYLPLSQNLPNSSKKSMKKKKRSASWVQNVLSPSYKQKNDDFHKFFKQLPETERLLVDYTCALMKDILVHGRMYVSQNYVCFHSTILKWQTAVMISFKDIAAVTKEKTAKLIPNAIQFQLKNRSKSTFASFTQRDRAYQLVYRLWQNALLDKPMTPQELWNSIHHQYGNDLGCSSDDDYMRPVFNVTLDSPTGEVYEYGTTNKVKRKKKHKKVKQGNRLEVNGDFNGMSTHVASQNNKLDESIDQSSEEDKFSSSGSLQESLGNEVGLSATDGRLFNEQDDDEPVENVMPDLSRVYLRREFGVSADTMFDTIYGDNCPFWKQYLMNKQTFDINMGKWQDGTDENRGNKVRYLDYNLTLTNPLGPKSSRVEETQVWYNESVLGRYAVDCVARTLGIPYADYFATVMRYCIRKVTGSTCELKISAELKFLKSPWGLVKSFIEKNAYSGIEENFLLLEKELDAYFTRQSHLPVQFPAVSKPRNDLPRRQPSGSSVSKQGHKKSRSSNEGSPRRSTDNNYLLEDVSSSRSELRKREMIAAPSTTSIAPVSLDLNNNKSSLKQSYHKEFGSRKWFPRIVALLFALLLFSNYTMYQRLNSLEVSHSRISSTNSLGISTANAHNIYEPSRTDDDSIAKSLENLDHRLARLEKVVQTHMSTSDTRWMELMSDWKTLHTTIQEILLKVNSHVNT
ncbi:uncharacterized protein LOC143452097 isoform X1 [Clavelina lepadiformis]|uniref:uncharacterized protein LOC143452097 isoform X1 n=1 Tax=Clavelina lepadiformis TaxID=159417 RepID=UPI004042C585